MNFTFKITTISKRQCSRLPTDVKHTHFKSISVRCVCDRFLPWFDWNHTTNSFLERRRTNYCHLE